MNRICIAVVLLTLTLAIAQPAHAQVRGGAQRQDPRAVARDSTRDFAFSIHPLMYTGFGAFHDPATESRWIFADAALGGGAALHIEVGEGILLGLEGTYARTNYERRPRTGQTVLDAGVAGVTTLLAGGRMSGGSLGRLGGLGGMRGLGMLGGLGYFSAGAGAIIYAPENVAANADLAFQLGGGLEFLDSRGRGGFLELKQIWAFHEREGVDDSRVRHSRLDFGARVVVRRLTTR